MKFGASHLLAAALVWGQAAPARAVDRGQTHEQVRALVEQAATGAVTLAEARVTIGRTTVRLPRGCKALAAVVDRPIQGSGTLVAKLNGQNREQETCAGWVRADVTVTAPVMIAARVLRAGEPLDLATTVEWREIGPGATPAVPRAGAFAARTLMAGQVLDAASVRADRLASGGQVKVTVRSGGVTIEQSGRLVSCGADRTCAVLPSGKHVEGVMEDGRLVVRAP